MYRKLVKAKGPAGAKTNEEKQKGLTLFGRKPPTPKMLRAFGNFRKGALMDKLKVTSWYCDEDRSLTLGLILSSLKVTRFLLSTETAELTTGRVSLLISFTGEVKQGVLSLDLKRYSPSKRFGLLKTG